MTEQKLLKAGIAGIAVAGAGCFVPALVVSLAALLGVENMARWIGWLDVVLLPVVLFIVGATAYTVWKRRQQRLPAE